MANDKNNNTLVADDDPTSELETLAFHAHGAGEVDELESGENTFDFDRPETGDAKKISRLQYDIETLRAKWQGLDIELQAREELTKDLTGQVQDLRDKLERQETLVTERDRTIKSLETEIRDRDERYRNSTESLEEQLETARSAMHELPEPPPSDYDTSEDAATSARLLKSEAYADTLRRKFQDLVGAHDEADRDRQRLTAALAGSEERVRTLEQELSTAVEEHNRLDEELAATLAEHVEEIRMLRFDLGEAQDTVVQAEELNAQLASDLVDTRGFKDELERLYNESDEHARGRIDTLEGDLRKRNQHIAELEEKLESRSEAVNLLLAELARKSQQVESMDDIGELISDMDERMSDRLDEDVSEPEPSPRSQERVTRVLLGRIGDKLLRFPLFKDQTTIGRADDNDIQLDAAFVSRKHAVLKTDGETTRVIDWGSRNGVYVNSERVKEHLLANGDIDRQCPLSL